MTKRRNNPAVCHAYIEAAGRDRSNSVAKLPRRAFTVADDIKLLQVEYLASGSHRGRDLWGASELDFMTNLLAISGGWATPVRRWYGHAKKSAWYRRVPLRRMISRNEPFPGRAAFGMSRQSVGIGDLQVTVQNAGIGDMNLRCLRFAPASPARGAC